MFERWRMEKRKKRERGPDTGRKRGGDLRQGEKNTLVGSSGKI